MLTFVDKFTKSYFLMLQIHDKSFVEFISQTDIETRIQWLGQQISQDYQGKRPLLVVVLSGAFMFASELFKSIDIDCEITFIRVSSYQKTNSTGKVREILGFSESLENRAVIIVEDIVDTGLTMVEIMGQISSQKPASVEVATLLHKPTATKVPVRLKYVGFEIENKFVIGYGLDYDQLGRNLPAVYQLSENEE